jgi:predicted glycoside hydrolase/deacetylase ChbG (UPF0249 family)
VTRSRVLIVNADDLGLSAGVDRGIARAHEHGVVTSASLMVRRPHAAAAAAWARRCPGLSVGLHVDLGEWRYADGRWALVEEVVALDDAAAVGEELERQLRRFGALVGTAPTHLDGHQHVHLQPPVRAVVERIGRRLAVPVRGCDAAVRHEGGFHGQSGRGEPWPEGIGPRR